MREITDGRTRTGVLVHLARSQLQRESGKVVVLHHQIHAGAGESRRARAQGHGAIALHQAVVRQPDGERPVGLAGGDHHRGRKLHAVRVGIAERDGEVAGRGRVAQHRQENTVGAAVLGNTGAIQRQLQPRRQGDGGDRSAIVVGQIRLVKGRSGIRPHRQPARAHGEERERDGARDVGRNTRGQQGIEGEAAQQLCGVRIGVIHQEHLIRPRPGRNSGAVVHHRPTDADRLTGQTGGRRGDAAHRQVGIQGERGTADKVGVVVRLGIRAIAELENAVARIEEYCHLDVAHARRTIRQLEVRRARTGLPDRNRSFRLGRRIQVIGPVQDRGAERQIPHQQPVVEIAGDGSRAKIGDNPVHRKLPAGLKGRRTDTEHVHRQIRIRRQGGGA